MSLVRLDQISIEFGDNPLLRNADLVVEPGERICLIGRNGAGKSTLLKIIAGEIEPDRGELQYRQHLRISKLDQQLPGDRHRLVEEVVREGLAEQQARIDCYRQLAASAHDPARLRELEALQAEIDAGGGWNLDQQVETISSQLGLPAGRQLDQLSGGWQRRVALGKALVSNPELLLLDEPTNHLDFSTIEWLEHHVRGYRGSVIFVTHDRAFIQRLVSRIVEIDRGKLVSWPGDYRNYLRLKEKANEEEDVGNALFDKRLAEEETWIRQGVKARRTRNEGRVRALEQMRRERAERIKRQGKAKISVETGEQSGRKVIEARNIRHGYGGEQLLDGLSLKIMRGDRIGLVGNNGVGKSTLLKILLGQIEPQSGSVKLGTNLQVAYYDQVARDLDPDKTVAENVGLGREYIKVNGKDRHVVGYLRNFLFSPKKAMAPVRALSGGERNRVMLAKLFSQPSNLLVLDEPTNDLDVEMLEALEQQLVEYTGTLLVVSHDREFLDNVVTSVLVFERNNHVQEYVGGYSDWQRRGVELAVADALDGKAKPAAAVLTGAPAEAGRRSGKLSYKYQRELDELPARIEQLEQELHALQQQIADPAFYDRPFGESEPVLGALKEKQAALDALTERWVELEEMKASG